MGKQKYVLWFTQPEDGVPKSKWDKKQMGTFNSKADAEARQAELVKERKLDPTSFSIKGVK